MNEVYPTTAPPDDFDVGDQGYTVEDMRPPAQDERGVLARLGHWILDTLLRHLGKRR